MTGPLSAFVELANAQGPGYIRGTELPWTAARPADYELFNMFMLGRDLKDFVSYGTSIRTPFDPKIYDSKFGPVRPASDLRRGSSSGMEFMETAFTEYRWDEEITWHELNLQSGKSISADGLQEFWNIKKKRDRDFEYDPIIKMEAEFVAPPSERMFTDNGSGLMPIKSFVTGINLWEARHGVPGEGLFPGMTNQQGLNPELAKFKRVDSYGATYANGGSQLAPTKVYYDQANNANISAGHLFSAMKYFIDVLKWKPTPYIPEMDGSQVAPRGLLCTREGMIMYHNTARAHGELFASMAPVGSAAKSDGSQYAGIPLITSDSLRTAKIYPDVAADAGNPTGVGNPNLAVDRAPVDERDEGGIPGARFYAIDPSSVNMWFAAKRPWQISDWYDLMPINPDIMARYGQFMGNMHFESFVKNGILAPSSSIAGYGA